VANHLDFGRGFVMELIKKIIVSGFDSLLARLLVRGFKIFEVHEAQISPCSVLEIIAAYLEHNLNDSQVKELEGHLVKCPLCRTTLVDRFKNLR
jgi:hypothetical protein